MMMKNFAKVCLVACLFFSSAPLLHAQKKTPPNKEDVRINFENVSMVEFLKFVSKVADVNLIYNPEELNFAVTITSQEPTSVENVLSALIQILRIHGFTLLEEDENLIIHNNAAVKQIATVVSNEVPLNKERPPALITRVFKVRKANPSALAALIAPMLSANAIVETSLETRHLIITDTASSIKTVEDLLLSLDTAETAYEVGIYVAKNIQAKDLVALGKQILLPMAGTNHIDLLSQPGSNSIYIVSTPFLVEKANSILAEVDKEATKLNSSTPFLIYNIKQASEEQIHESLNNLADHLESTHSPNKELVSAIDSIRWIKSSNSLLFSGSPKALQELSDLLVSFDVPANKSQSVLTQASPSTEFVLYAPKTLLPSDVKRATEEMAKNLRANDLSDPSFLRTLETARLLPASNQIMFTGDKASLERLQTVLSELDKENSLIIPLTTRLAPDIVTILKETAQKLAKDKNSSAGLVHTLESAQAMTHSNTVILSGAPQDLAKAQELIMANDAPSAATTTVIFVPLMHKSAKDVIATLHDTAQKLARFQNTPPSFVQTLQTAEASSDGRSVFLTGSPADLAKVKEMISSIDSMDMKSAKSGIVPGSNFLSYRVQHVSPQDLLSQLKQLVQDSVAVSQDQNLLRTVRGGRYIKDSHTLVFTGTPEDLEKIQQLLTNLDVSNSPKATSTRVASTYKMYKPQVVPGPELIRMVRSFQEHLAATGVVDTNLNETIEHLTYVNQTNTIIVSGTPEEIEKVSDLLKEFDTSSTFAGKNVSQEEMEMINDTGFLVVKLQNQSGAGIVDALNMISRDLAQQKNQAKNAPLIAAIQSVQWIEMTNSLIATGDPDVLKRLRELIEMIDRPLKQVFIEILVLETSTANQFDLGLRWGSQGKVDNKLGWGLGNYPITDGNQGFPQNFNNITGTNVPTGQNIPPMPGGFLGAIGDIVWHKGQSYGSIGSLLNAFKADADTTVVLSQRIIAQDNQNAKIFSGDNVPFTGSLVTTSGLSQTTNANLEYRNIGVTVSITPIIGDNGLITLEIDEEISEEINQGNDSSVSTNTLNGIRTSKTSAQTRVSMLDQYFLILCGTIRNQVTRVVSGVPCLGGLPLIGAAFNQNQKRTVSHNVVIFIRPHIIPSQEFYSELTKSQEDLFGSKEISNTEDYHKMLEVLRAPDDERESTPDIAPRSHISRLLP